MPFLFSNKFQLPKHQARKKLNFHSEITAKPRDQPLVLRLGGEAVEFSNGEWRPSSGPSKDLLVEYEALRKNAQQLKEENNFLKLKIDILLDMLTEETMKTDCEAGNRMMKRKLTDL